MVLRQLDRGKAEEQFESATVLQHQLFPSIHLTLSESIPVHRKWLVSHSGPAQNVCTGSPCIPLRNPSQFGLLVEVGGFFIGGAKMAVLVHATGERSCIMPCLIA